MLIAFGDNVRVITTPLTVAHGLAGLTGQVFGETRPSIIGVETNGEVTDDYAINVQLLGKSNIVWFSPALPEFVNHKPGSEIVIGSKRWLRSASGEWVEQTMD